MRVRLTMRSLYGRCAATIRGSVGERSEDRVDRRSDFDGAGNRAEPVVELLDRSGQDIPRGVALVGIGELGVEGDDEVGEPIAAVVADLVRVDPDSKRRRLVALADDVVDVDGSAGPERGEHQLDRAERASPLPHLDRVAGVVRGAKARLRQPFEGHRAMRVIHAVQSTRSPLQSGTRVARRTGSRLPMWLPSEPDDLPAARPPRPPLPLLPLPNQPAPPPAPRPPTPGPSPPPH